MTASRKDRRRRAHADRSARIDLLDYCKLPNPKPRGRPVIDDLSDWRVVDDFLDEIPVTPEEVDVIERWLGDVVDELFGPKDLDRP